MINRLIVQILIIGAAIALLWFGLSQIDFMKAFKIDTSSGDTEKKLGELFWETIERSETVIRNDSVNKAVDKLVTELTEANNISRDKIKLHIVQKDEANAFALPGNHLVVYTGLIKECDKQEELIGVLGHEIAHIEKRHVMKKLVKELGLSVLLSMAGGGGGSISSEAVRTLSSSAYDRKLETEADFMSVEYMLDADINPAPFADLMYKMSTEHDMPAVVYWMATHPESEERAKAIIEHIKGKKLPKKQVLSADEWKFLKSKVDY